MTDDVPDAAARAFSRHGSFTRDGDAFRVETTVFDGRVTATDAPDFRTAYTVTVHVPTLEAATADEVGDAVADGWFDTFERRLEDAPQATRADVSLETLAVDRDGDAVHVTFQFEWGDADRAADIAKTFVEYVEGTYAEGIIPGYDYVSPAADLVENASRQGGSGGGTPL